MQGPVVRAAQRNCKLIADTPAEGARLGKTEMMSVRGRSAADQARLGRHEPEVRSIAVAARFAKCEGAFVDVPRDCIVDPPRLPQLFRRSTGRALGPTVERRTMKHLALIRESS
jgi:hypothetical protein